MTSETTRSAQPIILMPRSIALFIMGADRTVKDLNARGFMISDFDPTTASIEDSIPLNARTATNHTRTATIESQNPRTRANTCAAEDGTRMRARK